MTWTSIKEALPPEPGIYICALNNYNETVVRRFKFFKTTYGIVRGFFNKKGDILKNVTHWQPMPDKPTL